MAEPSQPLKQSAQVALIALAVLLIGAFVFYRERVFFGDASFLAFNIINYQRHYIQWNRYGSIVTQAIPYIAQLLHLPIKVALIGYAVSFNLFYFFSAVAVYRCRQYGLVILMGLYFLLFFSDSYFWVSEVPQAVAWMFVYLGLTLWIGKNKKNIYVFLPLILILAFLTISTHFVAIIPLTYLWIYFILQKKDWHFSRNHTIVLSAIPIVVILFRILLVGSDSGENAQLHAVTHFSIKDLLLIVTTPVIKMFVVRCFTIYWPAILILVLSIIALKKQANKPLIVWTIVSWLGYFIIMGLTYGGYDSSFPVFHIESEWGPIGILFAVPFVYFLLPAFKPAHAIMLLTAVFVIRIGYISAAVPRFRWRNDFKEQVFTQMKKKSITKLALYNDITLQSKLMLDWSLPNECILMSAMNGDKPQLTFRFVSPADSAALQALAKPNSISISFDMLVPANLNHEYYNIDTTRPYSVMSYSELMK